MKLHELKHQVGARKVKTRKARGIAAGKGKTAGRGMNGQNSRSGGGVRLGFEGGQNPWFRRLPKRGFKNINHIEYQVVNLVDLNKSYKDNEKVDLISLMKKGLVRKKNQPIKILGNGKLSKKLSVEVDALSKSANDAIIKAGGKIINS